MTREKLIASQQAACLPLYLRFVVSQIEAEANSAKTMKASPTPRESLSLQVYL